jgi:hypothetical protein
VDGVCYDVDAVGDVGYFVAFGVGEEGGVEGGGVVCLAVAWGELACAVCRKVDRGESITFSTAVFDRRKARDIPIGVLRL